MGKKGLAFASAGSVLGFLVGMIIPTEGRISGSFLARMTGNTISQDPQGFLIASIYLIGAIAVFGILGMVIGTIVDSIG